MIGTAKRLIDWLYDQDKNKKFEIKEFFEKRTKTQNSYYWVLVSELAGVLRTDKDSLHEILIKRYATRDYISCLSNVDINKYSRYNDYQGTFKKNDNTFKSYIIYQESHTMDKSEFRILLDGLISECHEVGISTLTPAQIDEMKYIENTRSKNDAK